MADETGNFAGTGEGRAAAIAHAERYFDGGQFFDELANLVSVKSESQNPAMMEFNRAYLRDQMSSILEPMGFALTISDTVAGAPILVATRIESDELDTVLIYGHGDVCDPQPSGWQNGFEPYGLKVDGDRYFGRGSADNKAQHLINLRALEAVIKERGSLGFNVKVLIEMSEETGSPGLREFIADHKEMLAADVLIASDGPRIDAQTPTIFLGSRSALNFDLKIALRDRAYHSGNFGGLIADPAIILVQAIASITDARGQIRIAEWRPDSLTPPVKKVLAVLPPVSDGPSLDADWGEADLTQSERAFGWNSFAVLAMKSGNPDAPQNAISGHATATCQLRFVVGTDPQDILPALRRHLDREGFEKVEIVSRKSAAFPATRTDVDGVWVKRVATSIEITHGKAPHILPNLAGSIPNDAFSHILGLPTVWVPHSYGGCNQHGPNEHVLGSLSRDALRNMAGLFWDIGAR